MSFKEYLRKKESEGKMSAFAIIKDTVKFIAKNMMGKVVLAAIFLVLLGSITGVSVLNSITIDRSTIRGISILSDILVLVAPFIEAIIITTLIVLFLNKANKKDGNIINPLYKKAISKVFLLTILSTLFAILLGGVLTFLTYLLHIFIVLTLIVSYLYAFVVVTIQNAICEEPERPLLESVIAGIDTFFKKKFILKAFVLALIALISIFSIQFILSVALNVSFDLSSTKALTEAVLKLKTRGILILFIAAFVQNIFTMIVQMCFSSLYLIYSHEEGAEENDSRLDDLIEKLNREKSEEEDRESKNDFFEIYNNNIYKGKDDK